MSQAANGLRTGRRAEDVALMKAVAGVATPQELELAQRVVCEAYFADLVPRPVWYRGLKRDPPRPKRPALASPPRLRLIRPEDAHG